MVVRVRCHCCLTPFLIVSEVPVTRRGYLKLQRLVRGEFDGVGGLGSGKGRSGRGGLDSRASQIKPLSLLAGGRDHCWNVAWAQSLSRPFRSRKLSSEKEKRK